MLEGATKSVDGASGVATVSTYFFMAKSEQQGAGRVLVDCRISFGCVPTSQAPR